MHTKTSGSTPGEHQEILAQSDHVDLSFGDIRSQIAAEWLQIAQRSQWIAYRKPPSLFRMVPSLTPTISPCPQNWVPYAPRYANGHISATGDPIHFMFGSRMGFSGDGGANGAIPGSNKSKMAAAAMLDKFQMAISPQPVVRSTSCLVLGWGFRGRRN